MELDIDDHNFLVLVKQKPGVPGNIPADSNILKVWLASGSVGCMSVVFQVPLGPSKKTTFSTGSLSQGSVHTCEPSFLSHFIMILRNWVWYCNAVHFVFQFCSFKWLSCISGQCLKKGGFKYDGSPFACQDATISGRIGHIQDIDISSQKRYPTTLLISLSCDIISQS
jgi:hypothetical protein